MAKCGGDIGCAIAFDAWARDKCGFGLVAHGGLLAASGGYFQTHYVVCFAFLGFGIGKASAVAWINPASHSASSQVSASISKLGFAPR
jgi:hypothetical protein